MMDQSCMIRGPAGEGEAETQTAKMAAGEEATAAATADEEEGRTVETSSSQCCW